MNEIREIILTTEELADMVSERDLVYEPDGSYSNKYGITVVNPCGNCWRVLIPDAN